MPPRKRVQPAGAPVSARPSRRSTASVANAVKEEEDLTPPPGVSDVESRVNIAVEAVLTRNRRTVRKPTYAEPTEDHEEEEMMEEKPRRGKKRAAVQSPDELSAAEVDSVASELTPEPAQTPKKKVARKKKAVKEEQEEGEVGATPAKKTPTPRKPTPKKSRMAVKDEPEYDEEGNEIVKKKRKVKVVPKVIYEIPPVDRLETTFKGELELIIK